MLSLIWHKSKPKAIETAIEEVDEGVPGWHQKMPALATRMDAKTYDNMQFLYIWRRARELLRRAKVIE